ncbi:hypothetical protein [Pseudescherichia vulneris]|uniref:hypothetical protein n=1 Tax=Pseudescherichia vulneris TaxID=566 RepID=UPI0028AA35AC|nr:hypothetical protein [Pseudescherichia vulneris]
MTDSYDRRRTQTFTDEELDEFYSDAAARLEQDELLKRLGVKLTEVQVEWEESRHIKDLLPGVEPEFFDTYVVFADKLNPFSVIFTKDDDYSDYYRLSRPESLDELNDDISKWANS